LLCDLDLDPVTLIYKLDLNIWTTYLPTKNELFRSRLSKGRTLQIDKDTDWCDREYCHAPCAGGKKRNSYAFCNIPAFNCRRWTLRRLQWSHDKIWLKAKFHFNDMHDRTFTDLSPNWDDQDPSNFSQYPCGIIKRRRQDRSKPLLLLETHKILQYSVYPIISDSRSTPITENISLDLLWWHFCSTPVTFVGYIKIFDTVKLAIWYDTTSIYLYRNEYREADPSLLETLQIRHPGLQTASNTTANTRGRSKRATSDRQIITGGERAFDDNSERNRLMFQHWRVLRSPRLFLRC